MKRTLMSLVAGAMLVSGGAAMAEEPGAAGAAPAAAPTEADCKLTDINKGIDDAIAAIKASPAYGHAGGHYAKAEKSLTATKKELEAGCKAWTKGGEKTGAKPAKKGAK